MRVEFAIFTGSSVRSQSVTLRGNSVEEAFTDLFRVQSTRFIHLAGTGIDENWRPSSICLKCCLMHLLIVEGGSVCEGDNKAAQARLSIHFYLFMYECWVFERRTDSHSGNAVRILAISWKLKYWHIVRRTSSGKLAILARCDSALKKDQILIR